MRQANHEITLENRATTLNLIVRPCFQVHCVNLITRERRIPTDDVT
jgi:hypothetical protein